MSKPLLGVNTQNRLSELLGLEYEKAYQKVELYIYRYTKPKSIGEGIRWIAFKIINLAKRLFCCPTDWQLAKDALVKRYQNLNKAGLEQYKKENLKIEKYFSDNWESIAAKDHLHELTFLNHHRQLETTEKLDRWIKIVQFIDKYTPKSE